MHSWREILAQGEGCGKELKNGCTQQARFQHVTGIRGIGSGCCKGSQTTGSPLTSSRRQGLGIELITNCQWCNQVCISNKTSIKILNNGVQGNSLAVQWLGFDFHYRGHVGELRSHTCIAQQKQKTGIQRASGLETASICQEGGILQTPRVQKLLYSGHFQNLPSISLQWDVHLYPL